MFEVNSSVTKPAVQTIQQRFSKSSQLSSQRCLTKLSFLEKMLSVLTFLISFQVEHAVTIPSLNTWRFLEANSRLIHVASELI